MNIALACDHAGFDLKMRILQYLETEGNVLTDLGCFSAEATDYPEFGHKLAEHISEKRSDFGISLCGTGNGINMTANKHPLIRSALCWNADIAGLARKHNDANICALPARFITFEQARKIVDVFLSTSFEGERHKRRIDKIPM
jgi:ribose 5-phosphate isomerase B